MEQPLSRCIIVLGGHRTGTSLIAGILHRLGIPAALDESPENLLQGGAGNPEGHYEDRVALELHRRMLGRDRWRDPRPEQFELTADLRNAYRLHLLQRAESAPLWCLKDPRLCFLLPILALTLDELAIPTSVVTVSRKSVDTIDSLCRRNRFKRTQASAIVHRYEGARRAGVAWLTERGAPVLSVAYEDLLGSPADEVERLARFAAVPVTEAAIGFVRTDRRN